MLIYSDFVDFYDCIQKHGVDRSVIYKRYSRWAEQPKCSHRNIYVGFCGQRYFGYSLGNGRYTYDINLILQLYKKYGYTRYTFEKSKEWSQTFHNFDLAPIWVADHDGIIYNACLRNYDFESVLDPYTAYQKLYMWMSNLAEPRKPIPAVSNSDMIEAKGFDLKYSFRKEKKK